MAGRKKIRLTSQQAEDLGVALCECAGCTARHHQDGNLSVEATKFDRLTEEQWCASCANQRTWGSERTARIVPLEQYLAEQIAEWDRDHEVATAEAPADA